MSQLSDGYKLWSGSLFRLPKSARYTIGAKIDSIFIDCLELSLTSIYASRQDKTVLLKRLSLKFDQLKFFLKLLWEMKALDDKKYIIISSHLSAAGKMLGGWIKNSGN